MTSRARVVGVNPKAWFYGFRDSLRGRESHVRRVMAGASCEQWLNAEFIAHLAGHLELTGCTPYGEVQKKDGLVFPLAEGGDGEPDWAHPLALIESKIVYSSKRGMELAQGHIAKLVRQVNAAAAFEDTGVPRVGVLYAIHAWWDPNPEPLSFRAFRKRVFEMLHSEIDTGARDGWMTTIDHACVDPPRSRACPDWRCDGPCRLRSAVFRFPSTRSCRRKAGSMTKAIRKKLIEVALPLDAINEASAHEKSVPRAGHPATTHLWWARRPLAACRAVLFGQLVDDPSAWPLQYPTEDRQERERQRLFNLIKDLVQWENSNKKTIVMAARVEIARSATRGRKADGLADKRDEAVLNVAPPYNGIKYEELTPKEETSINSYLAEVVPPVHDPFAGGGSIPFEAQRLGLRAIATDLNPVAVLINKALLELPPKFAGLPAVNPGARKKSGISSSKGSQGLAEDVRYYGQWMRDQAFTRIGHLYPRIEITKEMAKDRDDLKGLLGQKATVIAWLWARTVASPSPALRGAHVPLVSSFWLSKKPGKEAWIEAVTDRASRSWRLSCERASQRTRRVWTAGRRPVGVISSAFFPANQFLSITSARRGSKGSSLTRFSRWSLKL